MNKMIKTIVMTIALPFLLTGCNSSPVKGDTGPQGVPGEKGEPGRDGVSIVSISKTSNVGNVDIYTIFYSNGTTYNFMVTNGVNGEQGIQGIPGNDGHTPIISIGQNGNWFIDGVDSKVKAQGPQGIPGQSGSSFLQGITDPSSSLGNNGDTYLNTTTYDLYYKVNGTWVLKCNVKGEDAITYIPCVFNNYNGVKLYEFYYEKGSDIVYDGPTPTRPNEIINGVNTKFEFIGWDKSLKNVLNPTIFTAQYKKSSQTPTTGSQIHPTTQSIVSTSQAYPTTPSTLTTSPRPASPYPAIQEGNGTEESPWNVTQAWNHVDKDLEECGKTSAQEQEQYIEKTPHSVRGYICYVEAISDGRDSQHPFSLKFHLADNNHYVTENEVISRSEAVRNGFSVYFSDTNPAIDYSPLDPTDEDDREEAYQKAVEDFTGKLVVVTGKMLNWVFEPEITSKPTFRVEK